ncbi:Cytochrome c oxidase assembly protein cox11, mitochondrial [Neophaeococcomyces mojaviensis]|uniref:Cytochrome c oxidase assembly protein cox11, mitochondrial n=1 Tax=Neophaeococcomyces mojaviensis TaxID=3383035 RepID=A0ACC3A557_9EURO|nr:Cytochrome c oxidase assembly protein cox11, mitochondrial [Knufia sp. JES_112]
MRGSATWYSIASSLRRSSSNFRTNLRFNQSGAAIKPRFFSATQFVRQHGTPYEAARAAAKEKNRTTMYYGASLIIATVALSYGSVPLYKMICQQTGWSGQPVKVHDSASSDPSVRLKPLEDHRRLRITFNGSVSDILPWKFTPQQREVRVLPGETALAFYTATNKSEADIIGVATYSVTPGQVAPYFSKIQCFCFEEQKLNAGETVDMPVFFFIDPEFAKDPNMRGIDTITLSYTFFKARYDKNGVLTTIPGAMMPA